MGPPKMVQVVYTYPKCAVPVDFVEPYKFIQELYKYAFHYILFAMAW